MIAIEWRNKDQREKNIPIVDMWIALLGDLPKRLPSILRESIWYFGSGCV